MKLICVCLTLPCSVSGFVQ